MAKKDNKPLVMDLSVDTDKKVTPLYAEPKKPDTYTASEQEQKTLGYIMTRYNDMQSKRSYVDKWWDTYQKQFEAAFKQYTDGRTSVNVPLEFSVIESYVSEAINRKPRFEFEGTGPKDVDKAKILEKVWHYDWDKQNRDEEILKNEYMTAIFGTSVIFTGFETSNTIIFDPSSVDENGKIEYKKKLRKQNRIILKNVDLRDVYFDDRAYSQQEIEDCVFFQRITADEFESLKYNPNYKNIEYVGHTAPSRNDVTYTREDETFADNKNVVELMHYWNKSKDKYIVVANRQVIVREHPILFAHKKIPFVIRQYSHNPFSLYGRGICEVLLSFKSQINDLKEMIMEGVKRSNNPIYAVGSGLEFDGEEFGFNNTVHKFTGQLSGNFEQITGAPPNAAVFNYEKILLEDVATYVGIDPRAIIGQSNRTAFETAVQQETSLKRVNNVLKQRDMAYRRMANLHLSNIQQFYPIKMVRQLLEITEKGNVKNQDVKEEFPVIKMEQATVKGGKMIKSKMDNYIEIKPELIRGNIDVTVKTNFNKPTLKQLERENFNQFLLTVQNYSAAIQQDPILSKMLPIESVIKDLAFKYDIDIDSISNKSDKKSELMDSLKALASSAPANEIPQPVEQSLETEEVDQGPSTSISAGNPLLSNITAGQSPNI